jgi:hypothetical protein
VYICCEEARAAVAAGAVVESDPAKMGAREAISKIAFVESTGGKEGPGSFGGKPLALSPPPRSTTPLVRLFFICFLEEVTNCSGSGMTLHTGPKLCDSARSSRSELRYTYAYFSLWLADKYSHRAKSKRGPKA